MLNALMFLYGLFFIFCMTISMQKAWRFFFLLNIGLGIIFYGAAVIATLFYFVPGEMGLRVLLVYFIWPVLNAAKKTELMNRKRYFVICSGFAAFWGMTFWLTDQINVIMIGYLLLVTIYLFTIDALTKKQKEKVAQETGAVPCLQS